jgi:hypothetical protein
MMMTLISACTDKAFRNGVLPMAYLWMVEAVAHNDNVAAWIQAGLRSRRRRSPLPLASGRIAAASKMAVEAGRRAGMKKALRRKAKGLGKLHPAECPAEDYPAMPSACM